MLPAVLIRASRRSPRVPIPAALAAAVALLTALGVAAAGHAPAAPRRTTFTHGFDVSWPQCHGTGATHMPSTVPAYLILGVTYGSGDTANPCLAGQLAWARERNVPVGAYLVPSYPTRYQRAVAGRGPFGNCATSKQPKWCRLRNAGAQQAASAVAVMREANVPAPMMWLDVEFRSVEPWHHHDHLSNRAVLQGVVRGMHQAHVPFGVYTTSYMWHAIAGHYVLDVPQWLPSGTGRPRAAQAMCRETATGGPTWLVQYTKRLDNDLTCPVLDPVPGRPGPLWPYRNRTAKLFDRGRVVAVAQHRLGVKPTGSYDVLTMLAARRYQQRHHLPVTGRVEKPEWKAWGAFRRHGGHPFLLRRIVGR